MGAKVLLLEDNPDTQEHITGALEREGERFQVKVLATKRGALEYLADHDVDCILLDLNLPDAKGLKLLHTIRELRPQVPVILVTVHGEASMIVEAVKLGAVDYVVKHGSCYLRELVLRVRQALGGRDVEGAHHRPDGAQAAVRKEVRERYRLDGLIGESPAMQKAVAAAEQAARSRASVLLQGETGTGKELIARAIHYHGLRANAPFVTINCPAIPRDLLESELFGHVKGAFTGANESRRGLFELADGGTIFLDEVGEIDRGIQVKLLRTLENGELHPVGATFTKQVHVRVIGASNRDLRCLADQGGFREDLYYRLSALRITLPPLRARPGDIPLLFRHFLARFEEEEGKRLGPTDGETLALLQRYSWPGNVRQLRNEVHRIVTCAEPGERVTPALLSPEIGGAGSREDDEGTLKEIHRRVEAFVIRNRLRRCGYNRTATARSLGVTREWLWVKMRTLGIEPPGGEDEDGAGGQPSA
jgi:DNA-binding NtrC family response regulator